MSVSIELLGDVLHFITDTYQVEKLLPVKMILRQYQFQINASCDDDLITH
jgi:hypothetical protein